MIITSNYIAYHVHSDLSLLDSVTDYKDYIDYAVELGQTAISISEHGKPLNWVSKKKYCDEKGIKYIHSVEIYITENLIPKTRDNFHTILIARNYEGLKEINAIVSKSTDEDHFYYTNRISIDEFLSLSNNVITTSACLASPLNKLPVNHPKYEALVKRYDYLEIQPHDCIEQIQFNVHLAELAEKYHKPLIAGTDAHSLNEYKAECRRIMLKCKHKSYGDEDSFDLTYKSYDQLVDAFRRQNAIPESLWMSAIDNTNIMAESVEEFDLDLSFKYPILYGSADEDAKRFRELVRKKFKEKVAAGIIPQEQYDGFCSALKEELDVFDKIQMSGFMLSMAELIGWCKENGIPTGFARGSVAGSRAAYVTDIIDVNPERWETVFSRFANADRVEPGDIDTDLIESDRPKIFEYIKNRFGERYVARVASYGTNKDLGTIDDIGRALRFYWNEEHDLKCDDPTTNNPYNLKNIDKIKKEFDVDRDATIKKYPNIFYYFDGIVGTKVSQSVHPAGQVISPITLDDTYGTFDKDGDSCLMLDMEDAHTVGLVKYDFLVLSNIRIIKDTCEYAGIPYPKAHEINWNDEKVWKDMLRSTIGIFQMESAFATQLIKEFKPKSIEEMSLVTACIRPSGASYRDELISRKVHKNPSPIIDELLEKNNGFLCIEENQLVDTDRGLIPIKDLNVGMMAKTSNGYDVISRVVNTGVKKCIEISYMGSSLKCSEDHKILTDYGWKRAGDIKPGDVVAFRIGDDKFGSTDDTNLAKIIGWIIGDGTVSENRSVHFDNTDKDVCTAFKNEIEKRYPDMCCNIKTVKHCSNGEELRRCSVSWRKHKPQTTPIRKELKRIGMYGCNAKTKFVPECVFDMNKNSILSFVGAYCDTDASLVNNANHKSISFCTSSRTLAFDMQNILRKIGVPSNISKENESAWHVCIKNYDKFIDIIYDYSISIRKVFSRNEKQIRYTHSLVHRELIRDCVSDYDTSLKKIYINTGVNLYQKNKYISTSQIEKISRYYNRYDNIEAFINSNLVWSVVDDISECGFANMYDITVDNSHEFVCQGIITHNCYQEDTIKFLQQVCGMSGSEADTIRRAIGKKNEKVINAALPRILNGYCEKSEKPREVAEKEAQEFIQILIDSASYSFGYNHSVAYCLLGYLCAYLRYYYPYEFITSYLNNAATQEDVEKGVELAEAYGISVIAPKFGVSRDCFTFDKDKKIITKGLNSIKYFNSKVGKELYEIAHEKEYTRFTDILYRLKESSIDQRQLDILIKIDFFSDIGNIAELTRIQMMFEQMKRGDVKKIKKEDLGITEEIVSKFATDLNSKGQKLKTYTVTDARGLIEALEDYILSLNLKDISLKIKIANQIDLLGSANISTKKPEDRRKLYIEELTPMSNNGSVWCFRVDTMSVGTGKRSRLTLRTNKFNLTPIKKGDIIHCDECFKNNRGYWELSKYHMI